MKDEEMAEKWIKDHSGLIGSYKYVKYDYDSMQQAFLAGLKAGRPQWHTPDARLPEEEGDYLFCLRDGEETMYDIVGVSIDGNGYVSLDSHIWSITDVIAWCELPTFDKE